MTSAPFQLHDPRFEKRDYNFIDRFFLKYIRDERDLPFVHLTLIASLVLFPAAVYLYLPGNFRWWLALGYIVLNLAFFFGRFILMLHNTSHRTLFKRKYRLLNYYIPWILGPFFGETPDTYYVHHVTMHHAENNLDADLSGTMRFQRDKLTHFLRYWARFFVIGLWELALYQWRKRNIRFIQRMLAGELGFYVLVVVLAFVNLPATVTVFVVPFFLARFLMMAGNWGQHAFIDRRDPGNSWKNSITCINTPYNKQCFNDGYHISHHLRPTRHWTDHPAELEANWEKYRDNGAIVFEGVDFFAVWALLMLKRYDKLVDAFVDLEEPKRSREEIEALLRERTRVITTEEVRLGLKRNELPGDPQAA